MSQSEFAQATRSISMEVSKIEGDWKEVVKRWHAQANDMRQVANRIWQTWLVWHVQNGSADKLRAWLDLRQTAGKTAAGPCPVQAVPKELANEIYATIRRHHPTLHTRSHVLFHGKTIKTIKTKKASKGNLPGWSAILLCHESIPSFTGPIPIPFDKRNAKLRDGGSFGVELRTELAEKGKGIKDSVILWSGGKQMRSQVAIYRKIVKGEFEFKGSNLVYSKKKRKWFANICYKRPVNRVEGLDHQLTAYLIPGRHNPFYLKLPGTHYRFWLQHRGGHIASFRQRIFNERRSRSENYRRASARKGKGREYSQDWRDKFSRKWDHFVKRVNESTCDKAVKECVNRGIGRLVYCKPSGITAEHRAVSNLGSTGRDQTTWQFYQLKTMLESKCQDVGIELKVIEFDGSKSKPKTSHEEAA